MEGYTQVIEHFCIKMKEILERQNKQPEVCKLSLSTVLGLRIPVGDNLKIGDKIMTITGKSSRDYNLVDGEKCYTLTDKGLNEIECDDKDFPKTMYYPKSMLWAEVM